jgi:NADH-quinone oxidoreductase subunit B
MSLYQYFERTGDSAMVLTKGEQIVNMVDDILVWGRKSSIWYLLFGLACCAIELMQTGGPRADIDRFGAAPRATPRQADLMIVAGTLTYKMALRTKLLYDQMAEPRYVISMGSCSNCGGLFQLAYSVCKGVDNIIPVDVYVPGCPPRPEALTEGLLQIQQKMEREGHIVRQKSGEWTAAGAMKQKHDAEQGQTAT